MTNNNEDQRGGGLMAALADALGLARDEISDVLIALGVIFIFGLVFVRMNACDEDTISDAMLSQDDIQAPSIVVAPQAVPPTIVNNTELDNAVVNDPDGDGFNRFNDRCPEVAGDVLGCPDSDGDGFVDFEDECPDVMGKDNGCPRDSDGDGINDQADKCPTLAGVVPAGGCPPDADADGIFDPVDRCPLRAGPGRTGGCPEIILTEEETAVLQDLTNIEFQTASSKLTGTSLPLLDQVVAVLKAHPTYALRIEGHTDDRGDAKKNLSLSRARAETCRKTLIEKGIARSRLQARGFGQTRPVVPNDTPDNRKANRRVEFILE